MLPIMLKSINDAPQEIADPIREFWPEAEWDNAASISFLESTWKWNAENNTTDADHPCGTPLGNKGGVPVAAEHSLGFFQINACNFPDWNPAHLFNARQNAGTAHALWDARGWSPWYFSAKALGLL
jgi:hypothetical protein